MQADNLQNAIIQLMIFIPCCLIGPYYWIHRMVGHRCVVRSISDLTLEKQILLQITALVFIAVGIYTQAVYGFGLIVIFAILGGIFNIVRIKEQWYLWLLIALIGMGFYLTQTGFAYNGLSTFVLYGALIYLSISGLRHWDKAYDIKTLP
jgi:nicotinamide riboside transporter PnuC